MSNQVQIFNNDELNLQVRTILNEDGSISVNAEDTAIGFGWIEKKNDIIYPRWRTLNGYLKELGFSQEVAKDTYIPESLFYLLGMKASNEKAIKYQKWLAIDVLPTLRKTGTYTINQTQPQTAPLEEQLKAVSFIANDLHVTKSGRIIMYKKLCESNHVPTKFLPDYVEGEDREAKPATTLLKQFDLKMSTVSFNKLLLNAGILEERERNSSKGTVKKFKALTENGLKYGKNLTSEQNPKEVQPYYYIDTFMELYNLIVNANVA